MMNAQDIIDYLIHYSDKNVTWGQIVDALCDVDVLMLHRDWREDEVDQAYDIASSHRAQEYANSQYAEQESRELIFVFEPPYHRVEIYTKAEFCKLVDAANYEDWMRKGNSLPSGGIEFDRAEDAINYAEALCHDFDISRLDADEIQAQIRAALN